MLIPSAIHPLQSAFPTAFLVQLPSFFTPKPWLVPFSLCFYPYFSMDLFFLTTMKVSVLGHKSDLVMSLCNTLKWLPLDLDPSSFAMTGEALPKPAPAHLFRYCSLSIIYVLPFKRGFSELLSPWSSFLPHSLYNCGFPLVGCMCAQTHTYTHTHAHARTSFITHASIFSLTLSSSERPTPNPAF